MAEIEIPDDINLPKARDDWDEDLNTTIQEYVTLLSAALNSLLTALNQAEADIDALEAAPNTDELVKGTSSDPTAGYLDAKVDQVNLTVDTSNYKLEVKDGSDLDTTITTVIDLLAGIIHGDIIFVNKNPSTNQLFLDKLNPTKYGDVLVCGGADANPFWDEVSSAPNAKLADSFTVLDFLENPISEIVIITIDQTIDQTAGDSNFSCVVEDTSTDHIDSNISEVEETSIISMNHTEDHEDEITTEVTHSVV